MVPTENRKPVSKNVDLGFYIFNKTTLTYHTTYYTSHSSASLSKCRNMTNSSYSFWDMDPYILLSV